jgi:hypothetical protein
MLTSCRTSKSSKSVVKYSLTTDSTLAIRKDTQSVTTTKTIDSTFDLPEQTDNFLFRGLPENRDTVLLDNPTQKVVAKKVKGKVYITATVKSRKGHKQVTTESKTTKSTLDYQSAKNAVKSNYEAIAELKKTIAVFQWWWILALIVLCYLIYRLIKL